MRAAIIQMRSGEHAQANLDAASALIRSAHQDGADFIATPEMTGVMQRRAKKLWPSLYTQEDDICVAGFSALAKELGIYLLIGSLAILVGERRAANRSFLFGPDGGLIATYDKIHLFEAKLSRQEIWRESSTYRAGRKAVVANMDIQAERVKLGLSICYDIRFSKLYRVCAQAGAHIISAPAAFTVPTGVAHWESLLRARAIEASSFIIAPAQGGLHEDGRTTYGHSMIVGPWGEILAHIAHDKPGYAIADIDLALVTQAREKIPAWSHIPDFEKP